MQQRMQQSTAFKQRATVVQIKDRKIKMLKKELSLRNPLQLMGYEEEDIIPAGGFGAVLAHAGTGKTALMVQMALSSMLRGRNVLHISLHDPVTKVGLWYRELFDDLAKEYHVSQINEVWETILPHRFIMTFRVDGFSVPRLEERINDLTGQGIFVPQMIIIDGLHFDEAARKILTELKALAEKRGFHLWFTVHTHRHEEPPAGDMPAPLKGVDDLFNVALQLRPFGKDVKIIALKGIPGASGETALVLDPSTMLIKDQS
jgi:hypothetical protein